MCTNDQELSKLILYLGKNRHSYQVRNDLVVVFDDLHQVAWDAMLREDGTLEIMDGSVKLAKPGDSFIHTDGLRIEGGLTADEIIRRLEVIRDGGSV